VVQKVVEIEESGLPLVIRVERPKAVEFAHKPGERSGGDIGLKPLVSVAAAVVDRFRGGAELLAARLGESGGARGRLPFPFVLPYLKARFAAVAASWRLVKEKAGEDASGYGSAEGVVKRHPQSLQIGSAPGCRGFFNAASGIPGGEIAYPLRKTAQDPRVQFGARSARCPFDPEEIGGVANDGDDIVRLNGEKLGKEIIFAAEALHRRNSSEAVVATGAAKAG
jgi:hypothetical protein